MKTIDSSVENSVGTQSWMQTTGGDLSLKERWHIISLRLVPFIQQTIKNHYYAHRSPVYKNNDLSIDAVSLPDSRVITDALEYMQSCSSVALQNHCLRTWCYAAAFAHLQHLPKDAELLAVACLLHDLGMTAQHEQHHANCRCFAGQGAYAAQDWAAAQSWPMTRQDQLFEIISLHMNIDVPMSQGIEAHLLQQAASCDVIGNRQYEFSPDFSQQVNHHYPRGSLNQEFIAFAKHEAAQRPKSRTAFVLQSGFEQLVKTNPYL
jgi:HD superfamily phosphodiesterase